MSFEPDNETHEQRVEAYLKAMDKKLLHIANLLKIIANVDVSETIEDDDYVS